MMGTVIYDVLFILILTLLAIPLGGYIAKVMNGDKVFLSKILEPIERFIYKLMGIDASEEMTAKKYSIAVLAFSALSLVIVFLFHLMQGLLPLNPQGMSGTSWDLAFNNAISFVTNTNWQAYSGENTLSYLTQMLALGVQNFLSAAVGIAVLFVLIRGFINKQKDTLGNFWRDLTKCTLYILIPLSLVVSIILVSQGVVQSFSSYNEITTLETGATEVIPLGPAASQIAIKQLGTNGGGFFGTNSAYPLENPTALSNLTQNLSILLIPVALCFAFGHAVKDKKQGRVIFIVMMTLFVLSLAGLTLSEMYAGPSYSGVAASGSLEGKEMRFGIGNSALWSTSTTAASNGSVNAMHDSLTPLGGMVAMFLMQLGEIVFGGVGCGLYGMIAFVILTVFIGGLMVGRTPEYLGKKIEAFDIKMVSFMILIPPLLMLIGTAVTVMLPSVNSWLTNSGAHGFSEVLYAFTSAGGNNGSAFAGYNANTVYSNVVLGIIMLLARFVPMISIIYLAGNLSKKKIIPASEGTLETGNSMFVVLLIIVVLIIGALSFLPALALGPIGEFFSTL